MKNNKGMDAANQDIDMPKRVVMIIYEGSEILDIAGPASVFSKANVIAPGTYDFSLLTHDGNTISSSGIAIAPHGCWKSLNHRSIDTLIVAGGPETSVLRELEKGELPEWLASVAEHTRRMVSVCTGAFALGAAGLLNGKRATTHWDAVVSLQRRFPESHVKMDQIYVQDGKLWTSAGILTAIDLALALVEEDLGRACAVDIANLLVLSGLRPADAPQKSALLSKQAHASNPMRDLLTWIHLNLTADLSVESLAGRMGVSGRHFRRVFQSETGQTPTRYVAAIRLEHAATLLRSTRWTIESIAKRSGFESVDTLQRGFAQRWNMSPTAYREMEILVE